MSLLSLILVLSLTPDADQPRAALPSQLVSQSLLLDIAAVGDRVVAVGERGHILISNNNGVDWVQGVVPVQATLTSVFMRDENLGWAVGHDAVILRTTDGGANWTLVNRDLEEQRPFLDVWFSDNQHGVAVGAYAFVTHSKDGGMTWTPAILNEEDDYHLNRLARAEDGTLYLAAEAGLAYRSTDNGVTWTTLETPYHGSFFGVLPLSGKSLLMYGLRGHLYRSEDGGDSWDMVTTETHKTITAGAVLKDGRILLVGHGGVLLISADKGRSFNLHQRDNRAALSAVQQLNNGTILAVGENGLHQLDLK